MPSNKTPAPERKPLSFDDVLKRMLATPPKPRKARALKTPKPSKTKTGQ